MFVVTIADISGDNAKHQLATGVTKARWIAFTVTGGSTAARIGDTNVSSSRGMAVSPGVVPFQIGPEPDVWQFYDLSQLYAYVPTGATLSISYGGVG